MTTRLSPLVLVLGIVSADSAAAKPNSARQTPGVRMVLRQPKIRANQNELASERVELTHRIAASDSERPVPLHPYFGYAGVEVAAKTRHAGRERLSLIARGITLPRGQVASVEVASPATGALYREGQIEIKVVPRNGAPGLDIPEALDVLEQSELIQRELPAIRRTLRTTPVLDEDIALVYINDMQTIEVRRLHYLNQVAIQFPTSLAQTNWLRAPEVQIELELFDDRS
jgi:hypothetical protein